MGRGAGIGSKSLNRRTRLPRRMHSTAESPSPSARRVVLRDAPCSESGPSWLRIRSVASRRATVWAFTVWMISSPGFPVRYIEAEPSVWYWVTQLAHTPTEATVAAIDTGAKPASTSLARRCPAR